MDFLVIIGAFSSILLVSACINEAILKTKVGKKLGTKIFGEEVIKSITK